jgi:hypothetical protein
MSNEVRITEVTARSDLRRFLGVPHVVYARDRNWVPPLEAEMRKLLDRRRNPFFEHGEMALFIAWRGGEPIGRISAQINRRHLELHRDATGHFGFLEAVDDGAVFSSLLGAAADWLRARGMKRILGPMCPSINDEIGVLIDGFDQPPMIGMAYSPRYYAPRLEQAGFEKARDLYALRFDLHGPGTREPGQLELLAARLRAAGRFHVRPIDLSKFREEMRRAIGVYNDAWRDNWGFVPVSEREVDFLSQTLRPAMRRHFVLLGEVGGQLEGIFVSLPNVNEAIADLGGRLFPFGWAKLLWRLKRGRFRSGRVVLAGIRKAQQQSPLAAALLSEMLAEIIRWGRDNGYEWAELSWVLEDNAQSLAFCQHSGGQLYKTYRLYQRRLDG